MNERLIGLWMVVMMVAASVGGNAAAQQLQPVSVADSLYLPAGGNGDSWSPTLTPDGHYVLFASTANNLLSLDGSNALPMHIPARLNVFARDRTNSVTLLASPNLAGTGGGNGDSLPDGISTDGRYVLFESAAEDLVVNDTNQETDVFVRDLVNGTTRLISVSTNGMSGNGESASAVLTPDGRYVAFVSSASDLVPNDANGIPDVFVRDLQANTTALISKDAISATGGQGASESPVISSDGERIAFYSTAINLVPGSSSANGDVYVRDLSAGTTSWVSTNARALVESVFGSLGSLRTISYNQTISADGKFVTYEASENSALAGVIVRHNLETGNDDIVATNAAIPNAIVPPYEDFRSLDMTSDGRFMAYVANVGNTPGTGTCIYVWDAQTGIAALASGDLSNAAPPGAFCNWPVLDNAGEHLAFVSDAPGLTTNTPYGGNNIYVRNLSSGVTTLVNEGTNGPGTFADIAVPPSLNADGTLLAFDVFDGTLVAHDNNHVYDVALRDVAAGSTELISVRDQSLPATTPNANSAASATSVDFDGRYIAFASDADNLVANDNNGLRDIFVRDLVSGTNILVSVASNENDVGHSLSTDPAISGDGRFVAFSSLADDLVTGDDNHAEDVFVRDLQNMQTTLVSVSTNGVSPGSDDSFDPVISQDGHYVLFHSLAGNLAPGLTPGRENIFVRDLQNHTNYALTTAAADAAAMTPDGQYVRLCAA